MMKQNDKNNIEDMQLRKILSDTKLSAGDNLKFRIMQQIETENSLARKKAKSSFSVLDNMFSVFGVMYAVIAITAGIVYFTAGKEALTSGYMYLTAVLIVSVCSMFWMISLYDERRRKKNRKE